MSPNNATMAGWTSSPDRRGTLDIVVSCVFTIGLCCWTSVCPNVPARSDNRWAQLRDKCDLACIGILGPEFLLGIAAGQRSSAGRSVKKFRERDEQFHGWTLTHAFFADMGGFLLQTADMETPIPLNAEQLYFLVTKGYLDYPSISTEEINDKNKADGLSRFIAFFQATWFMISCIARRAQGLETTTFELTTISFIVVMFATSYCWLYKPSDVYVPVILESRCTMSQIRRDAHQPAEVPYKRSPLKFVDDGEFFMNVIWRYYVQILHFLRIPLFSRHGASKIPDRIPSDDFLETDPFFEILCAVFILAFSVTFLGGWNFSFPTSVEQTLWRCASVYNVAFSACGGAYCWAWRILLSSWYKDSPLPTVKTKVEESQPTKGPRRRIENFLNRIRNISPEKDPDLTISLRLLIPVTFLCLFYCLFRIYILVEDVIGLRSLPANAYSAVEWSIYIPHV